MQNKKDPSAPNQIVKGSGGRFVRRNEKGQFEKGQLRNSDDTSRSHGVNIRQGAGTKAKKDQGDRGNQ